MRVGALLENVYCKFKLRSFSRLFSRFRSHETTLTASETFCVEVIHALGHPTVNEFAGFIQISAQNAAYKVANLVKKGYIRRIQSQTDKREYYLEVTDRFSDYYFLNEQYLQSILDRIRDKVSEEEMRSFEHVLEVMSTELMTEAPQTENAGIAAE